MMMGHPAAAHAVAWTDCPCDPPLLRHAPAAPPQPRVIAYIAMGVFKRAEAGLYASCSAGALAGVLVGGVASAHLDQKGFGRVLLVLMSVCCVLLFASAAGGSG